VERGRGGGKEGRGRGGREGAREGEEEEAGVVLRGGLIPLVSHIFRHELSDSTVHSLLASHQCVPGHVTGKKSVLAAVLPVINSENT